jgi:hypothetical protein
MSEKKDYTDYLSDIADYTESLRAGIGTLNFCFNLAAIGIKNELTKVV